MNVSSLPEFFFCCISGHCIKNSDHPHSEVTVNSYLSASYSCESVVTKADVLTFPLNFPKCDEEFLTVPEYC